MQHLKVPESLYGRSKIVVLGNSGSLLEMPTQDFWDPSMLVIGVNRILREGTDGRRYSPDIVVISDSRAYQSEKEALQTFPGVVMICDWIRADTPHVPFSSRPSRKEWYRRDIRNFPQTLEEKLLHINNASFHALQIAYCLSAPGAGLYLAGCESRWPELDDPRRKRHHFYSTIPLAKELRPFRINWRMERQWSAFSRWAAKRQRTVIDCSPWEGLQIPGLVRGKLPLK